MPPSADVREVDKRTWTVRIPNDRVYAQRLPFGRPFTIVSSKGAALDNPRGHACRLLARVQTVSAETHPFMHAALAEFKRLTGCSVIINTSFNVRGEPIVCPAGDAYRCFAMTDIDYLLVGNRLCARDQQPAEARNAEQREKWLSSFALD